MYIIDHTATPLFNDRYTYGHYWRNENDLTDWAEDQQYLLYDIAEYVGQNRDDGMDEAQARRTIAFARQWQLKFKMPDRRAGAVGDLIKVEITEQTLAPWMGLWTDARSYGPLIRMAMPVTAAR